MSRREQPPRVIVAMSGGLDSSVSAALLKGEGREVWGLHLRLPAPGRTAEERSEAVRRVALHLGISLKELDMKEAFESKVIAPFVDAYLHGITPNPCVVCNESIKFQNLLRVAEENQADAVATGHYARTRRKSRSGPRLYRGMDRGKDQSYFLHRVSAEALEKAVFPLGDMTREEVRRLAEEWGLTKSIAPESQEICFIQEDDYRRLVEEREESGKGGGKGRIITSRGEVVGEHHGIYGYTIGQRQGLGIASSRPYYVKELKPETKEIVVARREDLFSREVRAGAFCWIGEPPAERGGMPLRLKAQVRYRHKASPGRLEVISGEEVRFVFDEPQWAVTPGQALVCYDDDRVVGGGWIKKTACF